MVSRTNYLEEIRGDSNAQENVPSKLVKSRRFKARAGYAERYTTPETYWIDL